MRSSALGGGFCLLLIWLLLQFCHPVESFIYHVSICNNTRNYTSGGAYQQNLNLTIDSLVANASLTGYYKAVNGHQPNASYGLILCVPEVTSENCRACAVYASAAVRKDCPHQVEASIVSVFCTLQYSDTLFFSVADSKPRYYYYNTKIASDQDIFNNGMRNLLGNVSSDAAANTSRLAYGRSSLSDSVDIYVLAQCTKDISGNDCLGCLQNVFNHYILQGNRTKVGGRAHAVSCYVRFETFSFYQSSLLPPSPPPPPSSSPPLLAQSPETTTTNSTRQEGKSNRTILYVAIPVAVAATVVASLVCGCFFWRRANRKRVETASNSKYDISLHSYETSENESREASLMISLNTLVRATESFSDSCKLGEGGFGQVYKGILPGGQEIAVKRLSSSSKQGLEELKTEVTLVAKLMHRNLVRLVGFCLEEEEKLLVYEYLSNGSLDKVLFGDQNQRSTVEWERRYKIIVGLARGLLYLHEDSQLRVIHRDLKASNVLLDAAMDPKISDFGLARLFPGSQTHCNTGRIAGTYGYMAPEYVKLGQFSTKSDAYSFGILVLEIVTGRKCCSFESMNLQSVAWDYWSNGTALDLVDPVMGDQWSRDEVLKCIQIALMCVQEAAAERPTMSEVITMFSSYTVTVLAPSKPAFYVWKEIVESFGSNPVHESAAAASQPHRSSATESSEQSINEMTITDLDAR